MAVSDPAPEQFHQPLISPGFVWKTAVVAGLLALSTVLLNIAGHKYGQSIVNVGYSADTHPTNVIIGTDRLQVPANAIRFANQRRDGRTDRLDIFFLWTTLEGYGDEKQLVFNDRSQDSRNLVFATVTGNTMSLQMSERLEPVYRQLLDGTQFKGTAGVAGYRFRDDSRYAGEFLFVAGENTDNPFVARCLIPDQLPDGSRSCLRDFRAGKGLSVVYRFSDLLLPQWRQLDAAVSQYIDDRLLSAR